MEKKHLSHTGQFAGVRYCGAIGGEAEHMNLRALALDEHRAMLCPDCLREFAFYAYEPGDEMPAWVKKLRGEKS